jgi:hypothetical protein
MSTSQNQKASPSSDSLNRKISKQAPPKPMTGKRPEITMLISFRGKKNIPTKGHLDSGCSTPIAKEKLIEEHNV